MQTYYVDVDVVLSRALTEAEVDDMLDMLAPAGGALSTDRETLSVSVAIDAATIEEATAAGRELVQNAAPAPIEATEGLSATTEAARERGNRVPLIPELVGYAEIGEIAGVSRQRARQFENVEGFPAPVVRTAAGPLRTKAAVTAWAARRNHSAGRPRKKAHA